MKKLALTLAASALATTAAYAESSLGGWDGNYYGGQVGLASGDFDWTTSGLSSTSTPTVYESTPSLSGSYVGVFAGRNWTGANGMVFGLEGEFNGGKISSSSAATRTVGGSATGGRYRTTETEIDYSLALRGRAGMVRGNTLFYATAGLAVASSNVSAYGGKTGTELRHSFSDTLGGWTVGAGIEHKLTEKTALRFDYRYTDYGSTTNVETPGGSGPWTVGSSFKTHELRVGMSVQF